MVLCNKQDCFCFEIGRTTQNLYEQNGQRHNQGALKQSHFQPSTQPRFLAKLLKTFNPKIKTITVNVFWT